MTLSKTQFAATLLLTASLVGIGVGWLPRLLSDGEKPHAQPPFVMLPNVPHKEPDAQKKEKPPVRYQGKPASEWIAQFQDRDSEYRKKAVEPLLAIAEVDRLIVPVLVEGLKDPSSEIAEQIVDKLESLNPPVAETAAALLRSHVNLEAALALLTKIDPQGEVTLPMVRDALKNKQFRLRAGFMLIAFDKTTQLPVTLLVEALKEYEHTLYKLPDKDGECFQRCSIPVLAAWLLLQSGVETRQAVQQLINLSAGGDYKELFPPFVAASQSKRSVDWFALTLRSVDPQGEDAIPCLLKQLAETKDVDYQKCLIRTLGQYGEKARVAIPTLQAIAQDKKGENKSAPPALPSPTSRPLSLTLAGYAEKQDNSSLASVALDALKKIDPKATVDKVPASSTKPAKESQGSSKPH